MKPILPVSTPALNYLPDFARYILQSRMNEFIVLCIDFCKEAELPMVAVLEKKLGQQVIEIMTCIHQPLLEALAQNNLEVYSRQNKKRWESNNIGLDISEITIKDITLGLHIRRKALTHLLNDYTQDLELQKQIITEADLITSYEELYIYQLYFKFKQVREDLLLESQRLAGTGSFLIDFKKPQNTFYTPECLKVLDLKEATTLDHFMHGVHPEDRAEVEIRFKKCLDEGGVFEMNYRYKKNSEKRIWVKAIIEVENNEPLLLKGTVRDITQRYIFIKELKDIEKFYRQSQELNLIGSWSWDPASGVLIWSDEMCNIFEVEKGSRLSFGQYLEFVHPDDRQRVKKEVEDGTITGNHYESVYRIITHNGRTKMVYAVSRTIRNDNLIKGFYGTCQDISNLPQLQKKISAGDHLLQNQ